MISFWFSCCDGASKIGWYEDDRIIDDIVDEFHPTDTIVRVHAEMLVGKHMKDMDIGDFFTVKDALEKGVDMIRAQCSGCDLLYVVTFSHELIYIISKAIVLRIVAFCVSIVLKPRSRGARPLKYIV
ncbi:Uncharacterised protein r2_g3781 [Pycnogonum litorale]